jgi:hypothetical protein
MNNEKIRVKVTETGQTMDVVVLSKRASGIQVVIGDGVVDELAGETER